MTLFDFFTTSPQDILPLLKLNQALKRGDFVCQPFFNQAWYSLHRQQQAKAEQNVATYCDLIPLAEGKIVDWEGTKEWHILPMNSYVHFATFDKIAEILDLDASFARDWLLTWERWSHDGSHLTKEISYFETDTVATLLVALQAKENHPFFTENQLLPSDFIWNQLPVPPAAQFSFLFGRNQTIKLSPYFHCLKGILSYFYHPNSLNYKDSYRIFSANLHRWIETVGQPQLTRLWDLPPYETYRFDSSFTFSPVLVTEILPNELIISEAEELCLWNYAVIALKKDLFMVLHGADLWVYQFPTYEVIYHYQFPTNKLTFYKKTAGKVYFEIDNHLIAWEIASQTFLKTQAKHPFCDFSEIQETTVLFHSEGGSLGLSEVSDYPVISVFDLARNYFWGADKSFSGGIYEVATGLFEQEIDPQHFLHEGLNFWYVSLQGEVQARVYSEDDEFGDEETMYEAEDETLDRYDLYRKWKRECQKVMKPNAFDFWQGDWAIFTDDCLYLNQKLYLRSELVTTYAVFDAELGILYLENPQQIQVIEVFPREKPKVIAQFYFG